MRKDMLLWLCALLREHSHQRDTIHVLKENQVALFLDIVGHHAKNLQVKIFFIRSGARVSVILEMNL